MEGVSAFDLCGVATNSYFPKNQKATTRKEFVTSSRYFDVTPEATMTHEGEALDCFITYVDTSG